jgi:protein-S-isoprenylcysteine O-methyltransferase Ste14
VNLAVVGTFFFRYRNLLVPVLFALLFVPGPRIEADSFMALATGVLLALAGQCLRAMTIGLEYIVRGGRNKRVYAEGLVTGGIYAHTRNPMYLGNLLILAGVAITTNSWICVAVAMPLGAFAYISIVAAEERFLREKFGDAYDAYARDVPRWSVRLRGLASTLRAGKFHWRRLLVKEYGTTTAWVAAVCVTAWIAAGVPDGSPHDRYLRMTLVICGVSAILFFVCVRWLKVSDVVVAD